MRRSRALVPLVVAALFLLVTSQALASNVFAQISGSPFTAGSEPSTLAFSPNGQFLAVENAVTRVARASHPDQLRLKLAAR